MEVYTVSTDQDQTYDKYYDPDAINQLRKTLNSTKSKLDNIDPKQFQRLSYAWDPYTTLKKTLTHNYNAEMASNAWLKFFEIVNSKIDILPEQTTASLNTLHLCEAPGAFISSLNHYLCQTQTFKKWDWYSNTLPYETETGEHKGSTALSDHYGLIKKYPNKWILHDITDIKNVTKLIKDISQNTKFDLVTGDGSIDVGIDYNEQESLNHKLISSELQIALKFLKPKGTLLLKAFTLFEPGSWDLINLILIHFDSLHILKPLTSRAANSEIYILAKNKLSKPKSIVKAKFNLLPIIKILTIKQIEAIELMLNKPMPQITTKNKAANEWLNLYKPQPLPKECKLFQ